MPMAYATAALLLSLPTQLFATERCTPIDRPDEGYWSASEELLHIERMVEGFDGARLFAAHCDESVIRKCCYQSAARGIWLRDCLPTFGCLWAAYRRNRRI